jgi:hypothetical protein
MEVTYQIDGVNIKTTFGVYVSRSSGLLDYPEIKEPLKSDWQDQNGEDVDLENPVYKPRQITLECFIAATSGLDIIEKVQAITDALTTPGLKQLVCTAGNGIPLVYMVYLSSSIQVEKRWHEGKMAASFQINLTEPEPIKAYGYVEVIVSGGGDQGEQKTLILSDAGNIGTTLSREVIAKIHWGDGSSESHIFTEASNTKMHTYSATGNYYIVVTGLMTGLEIGMNGLTEFELWPENTFE